jgi:hypothetical protein
MYSNKYGRICIQLLLRDMSLEDILGALVKQAEIVEASCPDG